MRFRAQCIHIGVKMEIEEQLYEALKMAVEALKDNDIDESMAGEFEILTDALEAYERSKNGENI